MAGQYGWLRACRLFQDQKVKCKDCGAFGHTARSLRCPMKRWQGALVPLPLGSRFGKENLAWKLQDPPTPGTPNAAEREEEERQRKEEQQRKLLQRFPRRPRARQPQSWKEEPEPGLCLRHPNMPLLIHTSKRKSVQDPDHSRGSPTRKDDVNPASPQCLSSKPRLSPVQTPQQSTPTADLGAFLNLPPPPSTAGRGPRVAFRASRETPAQGQRFDLQPPADRSPSKSVRGVPAAHPPPISIFVRPQPLRMRFLRDAEGCWSCRYTVPPSLGPTERPAPPSQSPSVDQAPEGLAVPGPRSVLYDDLLVSSSSEESDWDADTSGN
ncbi:protein FAM90A5-like [Ovis canadensis]|uniref:protein FAM90A5-like n=1 Tax=Ovis canadensis TaxID=37174 RepID=UPI003753C8BD